MVLFLPTRQFVLRHADSYNLILKIWPLYVWIVVFIMTLFLLFKGLKRVDYSATWPEALWISSVCGVGIAAIAWLVCVKSGKLQQYVEKKVSQDEKWEQERAKIYARYSVDVNNNDDKNKQISSKGGNDNDDGHHVPQTSFEPEIELPDIAANQQTNKNNDGADKSKVLFYFSNTQNTN